MAEFTEEFDVEATSNGWATYGHFIARLRRRLGVRFCHDRPVLPPQERPPTRWFDIVLRTNSRAITLRIRRDNLYLDAYAYRMENADHWLEFGMNPSPHLIEGSFFLEFGGGYTDLEGAAHQGRDAINLGQRQLTNAVNQLATPDRHNQERARPLTVVIQMICESIRFINISDYLQHEYRSDLPAPVWMRHLENGWGNLSGELLLLDANATHRFSTPNQMGINNYLEAVAVIGILLFPCAIRRRIRRMADDVGQPPFPEGRPLVEVFSVRINNIDKEEPGDLYGSITITDGLRTQSIYDRASDDYESIHSRQAALLTGPARAISAYGSFTIDVALMDKDAGWLPDDEVARGQMSWNVYAATNEYDRPLFCNVDGRYGSITVNYAVLSDAVAAVLEVTLVNGDGEDPANVYGGLTALNGLGESELFRKGASERIDVTPGMLIPLSRSIVAVPLNSSLSIRADLHDHDRFPLNPDDEIAKGTALFPPQISGTSQKNISGQYGEIQVKVTWTLDI